DYTFVLSPPLAPAIAPVARNVVCLATAPLDYASLLGACDVVVTKPGYGVVADCVANHVAVLYTDRGPFREYDVLVQALPKLTRARYVPRTDLLAGQLGPHLDALLELPARRSEQRVDGARYVARRVLDFTLDHKAVT
ncbi:MAG: hypothetical protein LC797_13300, partial [Chloroflexi bacterium]|nr:hypothetical protein [Chloroflexota bacterium]